MKITILPVLSDNYIHVLRDDQTNTTIVDDPAEATPVIKFLNESGYNLSHIFLTHHHGDHIDGVKGLKEKFPDCQVYGFKDDQHRLPPLTQVVADGDTIQVAGTKFEIWHLPGHTTGHIAYISKDSNVAFTGDVLFGMGCGRLFEGEPGQLFEAMQRLKTLSPDTKMYCTHEYTVTNGHFAKSIFPNNKKILDRLNASIAIREKGLFTVPLTLQTELETNPFLIAKDLDTCRDFRKQRDVFKI